MQIVNHRLENDDIKYVPTDKHGAEFGPNLPDTIIIHYTAARDYQSAIHTLTKSDKRASAHLVVGKNGEIAQLVDFNVISWHAGPSSHKHRKSLNIFSIGIEIDNPGWLNRNGNIFTTWFGREVNPNDVVEARHRNPQITHKYWHRYTEKQIEVVEEICELLVKTYHIKYILGHEEISPGRKQDPGPAFPLDKLRTNILAADRDREEADDEYPIDATVRVNTSLNIRALPKINARKVAKPLKNNHKVTIIDEQQGWYKVRTEIEGWISGKYITKLG